MDANKALEDLLGFALSKGLVEESDVPYCRNLLLDALQLDAPGDGYRLNGAPLEEAPETAGRFLSVLLEDAALRKVIPDSAGSRELLSGRLMGCLTARPSEINRTFWQNYREGGPRAATDWFYRLCRDNDYIHVDAIAQNQILREESAYGELVITINLSKPEKDPRDIALALQRPSAGYPPCMLCAENPGYAGRAGFPPRQNHRIVPLELGGERWYLQYSPYLYYNEHCIVLCEKHRPMHIGRDSFARLFDFVELFPHYFIGSNADLPIVGGSILSHDHFQGGNFVFPMTVAPIKTPLKSPYAGVEAGILDWPVSTLRLRGADRTALLDAAEDVLAAWRQYSDEQLDILCRTDAPHNTITPILRKEGESFVFDLTLRNNRTTAEHPLGLFHPHADLHHIKRENIGLIEVMGLFILPGRLKEELAALELMLCGDRPANLDPDMPLYKHMDWFNALHKKHGVLSSSQASQVIRRALGAKCQRVLEDAGVFKLDEAGQQGFLRFVQGLGYQRLS